MLMSIQNIKNQRLICLDFDDCIIEWYLGDHEKIYKRLKDNLNMIKKFCIKNNYNIFIISTWSLYINDNLELVSDVPVDDPEFIRKLWFLIRLKISKFIVGKDPFDDRILAMEVLLDNGNKIICIDDMDFESHFEWAGDSFIMVNVINGINLKRLKEI